MLTWDILFGMNILTLAGFVVMGLTLTLNRMGQAGKGLSTSRSMRFLPQRCGTFSIFPISSHRERR